MSDEDLLASLLDEERRLQFAGFDNDSAIALGTAILERARAQRLAIAIDVTRVRQLLFHAALPGTSADNDDWIRRKTNTVYRFGHSSFYIGISCKLAGIGFAERYSVDPRDFAAHGGAFPVLVKGVGLVGTVAVSGLPQADDHRLVVEEITKFLRV